MSSTSEAPIPRSVELQSGPSYLDQGHRIGRKTLRTPQTSVEGSQVALILECRPVMEDASITPQGERFIHKQHPEADAAADSAQNRFVDVFEDALPHMSLSSNE